jgi:hypothetical protein
MGAFWESSFEYVKKGKNEYFRDDFAFQNIKDEC